MLKLARELALAVYPRAVTIVNILLVWVIFPMWAKLDTKNNNFYPATLPWGASVVNGLTWTPLAVFFH